MWQQDALPSTLLFSYDMDSVSVKQSHSEATLSRAWPGNRRVESSGGLGVYSEHTRRGRALSVSHLAETPASSLPRGCRRRVKVARERMDAPHFSVVGNSCIICAPVWKCCVLTAGLGGIQCLMWLTRLNYTHTHTHTTHTHTHTHTFSAVNTLPTLFWYRNRIWVHSHKVNRQLVR